MQRRGILITNLGTPTAPTRGAVKEYLEEFLMDPYVISLPGPLRYLLVKTIAKRRSEKSAKAYARVWTSSGGPLRDHANSLAQCVRASPSLPVAVGMRYGTPSFEDAHKLLEPSCDEVVVISAYPQYADSTYKSTVERLKAVFADTRTLITRPYFDEPFFIDAHSALLREHIASDVDHLLLSFHGVPELHIRKADASQNHCLKHDDCCEMPNPTQATCYRYQCLRTAALLRDAVSVPTTVAFQSRLGLASWLKPYTDEKVRELAESGVRNLAVACPSFISDNIETLYEIGYEVREVFLDAGGNRLDVVPCLNESEQWVDLVVKWAIADGEEHTLLSGD